MDVAFLCQLAQGKGPGIALSSEAILWYSNPVIQVLIHTQTKYQNV